MAENDDGGSGVHIFGGFEAADGSASNFYDAIDCRLTSNHHE